MTFFTFLILIIFIGITGWSAWYLFGSSNHGKKEEKSHGIGSVFEQHILIFLTGFGISSILLFLIALAGWFEIKVIVILFSILPAVCFARHYFYKRNVWSLQFSQYLLSCMILGFACFGLGKLAKPFEAVIQADDASVYIGAAFQLAKSGSLSYRDPLVIEMTQEERNQVFDNRFATDTTGDRIRFPGGVRLINSSTGAVVFSFYHLFPVWLGLGIQTLGEHSFLNLLSFFLALKLISLFLLAREAGGLLLGISVPLVCFIFYPQLYFSLMPTSELLTEALFLSGLWVFVSGIKSQPVLIASQQIIVGVLWGALFLCRLETLFMLSLSLILLFTIVPIFAMNWSKWRILIMELLFFLCLAFYYQIRRGEYLYVLTSSQFLGNQAIVLIGIELLNSIVNFVQNNPLPGFLAFLIITTTVLVTLRWWILRDNAPHCLWFKASVGILFIGISLAALVGHWASWHRFTKHIYWISLYFSPPILLTLFAGTLFFLHRIIREQTHAALWTLFIMFSLPAISYLVRPLIIIDQPWGIRKFVPMVFPLFFLISLAGWLYYLKGILLRPSFLARSIFCVLIFLLTAFFFGKSRYLLQDALFADLIPQIRSLASIIPKDGLIVIPESWAAMHLQIPLQYLAGRDTILLPVEKSRNNKLLRATNSFLDRQIKSRPVKVLLKSSQDPPATLRNSYRLKPLSPKNLSFSMVPRTQKMEFPGHSEKVLLNYTVFDLIQKEDHYEKALIRYDDPDVSFVDFHEKEGGFRWTQERSVIKDFVFRINEKDTIVIVSTLPDHSYYRIDNQGIRLQVNDRIPARLLKRENGDFFFDIDETAVAEITSVTIFSKTFVPLEKGINLDPRRLGICFSRLTLQRVE